MNSVGFSTGALGLGDLDLALTLLQDLPLRSMEFSALRWHELEPVAARMADLPLERYDYVSFHAPSAFTPEQEPYLVDFLRAKVPARCNVVVHPDSISRAELWGALGQRLALENMDKRKLQGRSAEELAIWFSKLPEARFCFDVGHARQLDPSMTDAYRLLRAFQDRLVEVHVSEVAADGKHDRLSEAAILAISEIADLVALETPLIIESRVTGEMIPAEIASVQRAFSRSLA